MTDLKISELEDGGSAQAADAIPIARSGQNYYVTAQYLKNFVFGSSGTIAIAAGKTFSVNNTITLNSNDGISVNFGSGGTFIYTTDKLSALASTTSSELRGVISDETGTGSLVFSTSPTLVTPVLGTPQSGDFSSGTFTWPTFNQSTTGTASNVTGIVAVANGGTGLSSGTSGGVPYYSAAGTIASSAALAANALVIGGGAGVAPSTTTTGTGILTFLGTPSSANLRSAVTDETGTGALVFADTPTLVTPVLGTPTSGTLTNCTGYSVSNLSNAGTGITTFLTTPSSANLASAVTDETGSGPLVFATSPTFTSQVTLGTQSTTRGTLVLANTTAGSKAVTLQSSNSTAAAYTLTFPAAAPVNGYYLQTDTNGVLSWAAGGGGGSGSPGGSNTQVQFNDSATFGGEAAFTYDKTTYTLGLGVASTTTGTFKLYNSSSANSVSLKSGNNSAAWTLTLPTSAGTNNYALLTDGSGNTSWGAVATGTINTGTAGQITYYSGTNTLSGTTTGTGVLTALGFNTNEAGGVLAPASALTANAIVIGGGSGTGPSTTTTGTGVLTAIGYNTNSAGGLPVLNGSGFLAVAQGGTATGTAGIGAFNNITGYSASGATGTTSTNLVFSTSPTITTPTISGNETHTGTGALFLADFSNATVASRFSFQTSTTNGLTGIYALPNGSATGAAWQATNNSDPTNASKIMITTNASTDVQLVSGINGTGTYLPLSIYTSGGVSAQFSTTKGTFDLGVTGSTQGILNLNGSTAGTISVKGAASAGTWTFTLPTSGGVADYALTTNGSGTSSWSQISLTAGVTGTLPVANGGTGITSFGTGIATWLGTPSSANLASAVTDETGSGSLVFATSPTLTTPRIAGSSTGYTSLASANSSATNYTVTFPAENMTVGFRNIPPVGTKSSGAYPLAVGDVGKYVQVTGGSITIPDATFAEGDIVSIFNNTSGNITLTCSITTAYIAGTDSDKATMTLATRGVATILFISSTVCVVSGNVS